MGLFQLYPSKIGSHDTIHTFKNYFTTILLVFSNKRYPNRPLKHLLVSEQVCSIQDQDSMQFLSHNFSLLIFQTFFIQFLRMKVFFFFLISVIESNCTRIASDLNRFKPILPNTQGARSLALVNYLLNLVVENP